MKLQRTVWKKHRLRIQEATEGENWEGYHNHIEWMVAWMVKNLPAMQETLVRSLGQEDPLEKGMATHSVFLPGKSHGKRSLVGYSPWGHKEWDRNEWLSLITHHSHGLGPSGKKICKNWPLGGDAGLSVKLSTKCRHRLTSHLRSCWVLHETQVRSLNSGCTTVGND